MLKSSQGSRAADIITFLKNESRLMHKQAEQGNDVALYRIRQQCPSFAMGMTLQRKHCLATVARELGFDNWKAARDCFTADGHVAFGAFLHPRRCHVYWNIWFADLHEARRIRAEHGGNLLSYKNQFMVVDKDYIVSLGTDPKAVEWDMIERDWTLISDVNSSAARAHLASVVIEAHLAWHSNRAHEAINAKLSA
jgi:hypothetical protein